jgi:hypothetical protein
VSLGKIITVIVLAIVVTFGILFAVGPLRVWKQWEVIGGTANDNVKDVISFALQAEMSEQGMYDPRKDTHQPSVQDDVIFIRPLLVMSMPDSVQFRGDSNEGAFEGHYNPHTGEVQATVAYGGYSLGGIVEMSDVGKSAPYSFKMTGRKMNGHVTAESNGQSLQIVYPPEDDEKKP